MTAEEPLRLDPRLVALWEEFVGPPADADADAFAAGADSMAVVLLLGAIAEDLGVSVEMAEFLDQPTLRGLNARLGA